MEKKPSPLPLWLGLEWPLLDLLLRAYSQALIRYKTYKPRRPDGRLFLRFLRQKDSVRRESFLRNPVKQEFLYP